MQFEQFTYPSHEEPLVKAYGGRFESVYVLLHPFFRMPDAFSYSAVRHYPDDAQILKYGVKVPWAQMAAELGISACARLNQAMLTSIGALSTDMGDYPVRDKLHAFLMSGPVWMPAEGRFEPLLKADLVQAFVDAGHNEMVYVPELPELNPMLHLGLTSFSDNADLSSSDCGTLAAPDGSFLFTVDWESFFTLFYGPRAFVEKVVRERNLEGFFAAPTTEHNWFNYSFGCATVTLSPEHWPA